MACPPQVFGPITAEQFKSIAANAAAVGVHLKGNQGEVSLSDIALRWQFDPTTGMFAVQCIRRPFIVTCAAINERIHGLIQSCTAAGGARR